MCARADDNSLLDLADHLPVEAAEALLELATGGTPPLPSHTVPQTDPFEHPDARRRFRVMHDVEELERALDYPWEKWVVFLHPDPAGTGRADLQTGLPAYQARPAPAKPSSRSTVPSIWRAPIPVPAFC